MTQFGTLTVKGASGVEHAFTAYSRDTNFNAVGAVYLMSKRLIENGCAMHTKLYCGQTQSLADRPLNHHKKSCFDASGANCVCILVENDEDARLSIETDILRMNRFPCND